ncbi:MAG: inositol-phosphate phosphatase [Acidimicrobiales bacterium]|nr:inositol-phosphate phosphatase [Acidimicrobiales bacterium]
MTDDLPADPAALLAVARPIAEDVAAHLEAALEGEGPVVTTKSTLTDLVTELDTWAESHITERLLVARPDDGVYGEEGARHEGTSGITWSVDPIDGTVNFVHGIPSFCVSIGAVVGDRSIAGVVAAPMYHEVFSATLGGGAFLARDRGPDVAIGCSSPASLAMSIVGTGFGYDPERRRRQAEVVSRIIPLVADVRRFGAAALDLCWVACGRFDGYWEVGLNPWDRAAGELIVAEAGGRFGGIDADRPSAAGIVAAGPDVYDDLLAALRDAGAGSV